MVATGGQGGSGHGDRDSSSPFHKHCGAIAVCNGPQESR